MIREYRERRRCRLTGDDAGVTIVELIVSMGIFVMVLVVFLAATVTMSRQAVRTQAVSDNASQLRTVFQRLDKELRYASAVNVPGTSNGDIYVEYLVPATASTGDALCVQWRYDVDARELQRRSWAPGDATSVSGWSTAVTDLRNDLTDPAQAPFVFHRAGPSGSKIFLRQGLTVHLDAGLGVAGDARGSQLHVYMVARNSSTASETNSGSGTQACLVGAVQRP